VSFSPGGEFAFSVNLLTHMVPEVERTGESILLSPLSPMQVWWCGNVRSGRTLQQKKHENFTFHSLDWVENHMLYMFRLEDQLYHDLPATANNKAPTIDHHHDGFLSGERIMGFSFSPGWRSVLRLSSK
jgi:hypothetical protein